ncbi:MAG: hypothetical protein IKT67_10250 [Lachnospiraceae bacterium]|nr:hypothetical protein [Lachnospiraceae bacterium]
MKNEKILYALGKVKEEFIEEAAPGEEKKTGKSSYGWVKWAALVACAVLVIGIGAPRVFRAINDDKRSFWPEEQEDTLTNDMVTALTTVETDFTMNRDTSLPADEGFPDWGLTLSVKDVTPTGLTLVCTKNGGNPTGELTCGTDYHLIVLEDGVWKDVPTVIEEYAWNSLAYHFPEGQDTEFDYTWEWLYGKLPAGMYRLTKGFMDFRGAGDYDTAVYWVEFEIK